MKNNHKNIPLILVASKQPTVVAPQPISIKEGESLSKYENCYFDVLTWIDELKITANGRYLLSREEKTVKIWEVEQNRVVKVYENIVNLPSKEQKFLEEFSSVEYDKEHSNILIEIDFDDIAKIEMWHKENSNRWRHTYYYLSTDMFGEMYFVEKKGDARQRLLFDGSEIGNIYIRPLPHSFSPTLFDVSQSSNYIFSKSKEESLEIWKRERERLSNVEELHEKYINCVAISQDKKYMLSGAKSCYDDEHSCLNLWDLERGKLIKSFEEARDVYSVCFSFDGEYIVSGSGSDCDQAHTYLQVWNRKRLLYSILDENYIHDVMPVSSVGISFDGKHIFSECYKSVVICTDKGSRVEEIRGDKHIWNIEQLKGFKTLSSDVNELTAVTVSEDGRYLVSASRTGIVSVWDREIHQLIERFFVKYRLYEEIKLLSVSSDNRYIGLGFSDRIDIWDREEQRISNNKSELFKSMKIDNVINNQEIISAEADGTLKVRSIESNKLLQEYIAGREGNWMIRDFETQKVYKGDNGNFLFEKKVVWHKEESVVFEVEEF